MHLVMLSTGEYSDRTEYQLGVTSDEALAKKIVGRIEQLIGPVQQAKSEWRYPDNPSWEAFLEARKAASRALLKEFPQINVEEYSKDSLIEDDSTAWVVQVPVLADQP